MNSVKFKLERGGKIQWPNYCAMCGCKATHEASTSFTATKNIGYYIFVITFKHQTYSIPYPVCRKHKIICNLLDHPTREPLLRIVFFIFITSFILWGLFYLSFLSIFDLIGLKKISKIYQKSNMLWLWIGLIAFVLVMLYVTGIFKPIKISNIEEDSMIISIKNNKFFNDFKILNRDKIINN